MRTTLDIADDVLQAAKELARRQGTTAGKVISALARQALSQPAGTGGPPQPKRRSGELLGFRPFPRRGGVVTNALVNQLREAEPA